MTVPHIRPIFHIPPHPFLNIAMKCRIRPVLRCIYNPMLYREVIFRNSALDSSRQRIGCRQFGLDPVIGIEQDVFVLPRLFDSEGGTGRKKNRRCDQKQKKEMVYDLMHRIHMTHSHRNEPTVDEMLQPSDK